MIADVLLRAVNEADLPIFYAHQLDPLAAQMAGFTSRDWEAFLPHWTRILANPAISKQTILFEGQVAGNIVAFTQSGERDVGYWLWREYWGKGIATRALAAFLTLEPARPLHARVARHNPASRRVLEKCGFRQAGEDGEELILKLGE